MGVKGKLRFLEGIGSTLNLASAGGFNGR